MKGPRDFKCFEDKKEEQEKGRLHAIFFTMITPVFIEPAKVQKWNGSLIASRTLIRGLRGKKLEGIL